MALVLGTNCGFVTVAPTTDPGVYTTIADDFGNAMRDISPVGTVKVTEIGWWCDNETQASDFEVGIYTDAGNGEPELLVGKSAPTAKGDTAGWKSVAVDISISPSTNYWIAIQLDNTTPATDIDFFGPGTQQQARLQFISTLPADWGESTNKYVNQYLAIYAVREAAVGTNMQANISDVLKDVSEIKINIGGVLKDVTEAKINIGGVLKDIF